MKAITMVLMKVITMVLADVITNTMLQGVLDEIIEVLPITLPVVITFMAIRKGISFVIGMLRSA